MNNYATHLPVLQYLMPRINGPILELGIGNHSTRLFHESGHPTVSCENVLSWFDKFRELESDTHKMIFIDTWTTFSDSTLAKQSWGLIFIDFGGGRTEQVYRGKIALAMKDMAPYIVCHDTEQTRWFYSYSTTLPLFKYRYDYKKYKAWTSVLSETEDVSKLDVE